MPGAQVRGRADLLISRPRDVRWQRFVVECKLERGGHTSGVHEGHLALLGRQMKPRRDNVFRQGEKIDGMAIEAWSMRGCAPHTTRPRILERLVAVRRSRHPVPGIGSSFLGRLTIKRREGVRQICCRIGSGCLRTALPIVLATPAENGAAQR